MNQLNDEQMKLWDNTQTSKITVLCHALNEEKCIGRMLESVKFADHIIVLVDSRTTDRTGEIAKSYGAEVEDFEWCDDFSYPKNILTAKVPKGDWCLMMGSDFEMLPHTVQEIRKFVQNSYNVAAKFMIPEYAPDDRPVVTRPRTLLWRSHPLLYWERLVHEEMIFSLYRMLAIGIPFTPEKEIPLLGGDRGILHYADYEDTPEEKWRKRCYYMVLYEIDRIKRRSHIDVEFNIPQMVLDYMDHGIPTGLTAMFEKSREVHTGIEYE
jgi:glycosyltransferase involved in cell wall biosynthesis